MPAAALELRKVEGLAQLGGGQRAGQVLLVGEDLWNGVEVGWKRAVELLKD
jgi:hypothetical protein